MLLLGVGLGVSACSKEEPKKEEAEQPAQESPAEPVATPAVRPPVNKDAKPMKTVQAVRPQETVEEPGQVDEPVNTAQAHKDTAAQGSALNIAAALEKSDIREAVGYLGLLEEATIVGQPENKQYGVTRWSSEGKNEFGFGLQVWKPGSSNTAVKRFDDLYAQSMGGEQTKDVGDSSFRTEHHDLRSIVFLDRRRSLVASLTCDKSLCTFDQLVELSRRVKRRL
ncbi:MAG: hypothetical protein CO108_20695 [Deltaproteobacteria bacterium CG_4_9_14_3_um_filter_63_12]|nr:MAG: hypothetical protein CO108_20695 [Deltaproteobacteria bacterium CG_4_9_14_3_um_filter_63_12]